MANNNDNQYQRDTDSLGKAFKVFGALGDRFQFQKCFFSPKIHSMIPIKFLLRKYYSENLEAAFFENKHCSL